jgi:hypothetical protein
MFSKNSQETIDEHFVVVVVIIIITGKTALFEL